MVSEPGDVYNYRYYRFFILLFRCHDAEHEAVGLVHGLAAD